MRRERTLTLTARSAVTQTIGVLLGPRTPLLPESTSARQMNERSAVVSWRSVGRSVSAACGDAVGGRERRRCGASTPRRPSSRLRRPATRCRSRSRRERCGSSRPRPSACPTSWRTAVSPRPTHAQTTAQPSLNIHNTQYRPTISSADAEIAQHTSRSMQRLLLCLLENSTFFHTQLVFRVRIRDYRILRSGWAFVCRYSQNTDISCHVPILTVFCTI